MLGAIAFVCRVASLNLARAEQLSALAGGDAVAIDATSPTGYEGGVRKLVLPELNHESLQWIAQTQELLARREWRLRHIAADNAPQGRPTFVPSPYRWWLGAVAWADSRLSGRPTGVAVERAALLAGPLLQILLLVSATLYAVRFLGALPAGLLALALALGFPAAGNFLSPLPGDRVLAQALAVWAVLPLVTALVTPRGSAGGRSHFLFAGVAGGLALWLDVGSASLIVLGCVVGGFLAAGWQRGFATAATAPAVAALPWRVWAWAGAGTSVLAYVAEYAPAHLAGWRFDQNHPLYALAWLGAGELLHRGTAWLGEGHRPRGAWAWLAIGAAGVAVVLLPVGLLVTEGNGMFGSIAHTARFSLLPGTVDATNLFEWMIQAPARQIVAALLPLALLLPAGWRLWTQPAGPTSRAVVVALGPVLVLLAFAGWQVALWATLGAAWLGLLAVLAAPLVVRSRVRGWAWAILVPLALAPGAVSLWPAGAGESGDAVSGAELEALLQRDLAYWLTARAPENGAVVVAPPAMTSALYFFGGIRGLGTPDPGNHDGFVAAVRLCAATSADEAEVLMRKREITHIVLPSWDPFLDEYVRLGSSQTEKTLIGLLHHWLPPRWLRPVPYILPQAEGIGDRSVVVFEVTEVQEQCVALARLAEYFVELGRLGDAGQVALVLEKEFPDDLDALIARAVVAHAHGAGAETTRILQALRPVLDRDEDADLPWDRRVALTIVLAQVRQPDLAKPRVQDCLATVDEARLRQLSTVALFRLQVLAKAFGQQIEDSELRAKARNRLPAEMRARL